MGLYGGGFDAGFTKDCGMVKNTQRSTSPHLSVSQLAVFMVETYFKLGNVRPTHTLALSPRVCQINVIRQLKIVH